MAVAQGTILRVVASLIFPDDVIMQNVFHLVLTTIVGDGDDDTVGADMEEYIEDIYDEIASLIVATITTNTVIVYKWDPVDSDWDEVFVEDWNFTPLNANDMLPHGVAAVQSFTTTDPDVRGRKFWGGITEFYQDESALSAAAITALIAAGVQVVGSFVAPVGANVYTPGVWSPTEEAFFPYGGTVITNAVLGYQRRRKPGVGI